MWMVDNFVVVFVITGTMTSNSGLDLHQPHSLKRHNLRKQQQPQKTFRQHNRNIYRLIRNSKYCSNTHYRMTLPGADEVQLRARYLGTGNADTTTKYAFLTNQHRDTAASIISHTSSQCAYYAVAQNESIHRTKYNLLESMIQPCGIPPHLQQQQQQQKQSNVGITLHPSSTTP